MDRIEGGPHTRTKVTFTFDGQEEVFVPEVVDEIKKVLKLNTFDEFVDRKFLGNDSLSLDVGSWAPKGARDRRSYPSVTVQSPPVRRDMPITIAHFYDVRQVDINDNNVRFSQTQNQNGSRSSLSVYTDGSIGTFITPPEPQK